jgi:hypothetical protein
MSYKEIAGRLAELEDQAPAKTQAELEALTEEELDALIAAQPPDPEFEAAVETLSEADLDRALAGTLSGQEIRLRYHQSHPKRSGIW